MEEAIASASTIASSAMPQPSARALPSQPIVSRFRGASTSPEGEVAKAWEIIAEQLDTAVAELHEADRHAILLRFYENKSLREIGERLGRLEQSAEATAICRFLVAA